MELGVIGGKEGKHVTTLHRLSFEEAHYLVGQGDSSL